MGRKFNKLEHSIEHEYEGKGFSHKRALYIGKATAGKIYREQQMEKCHSCGKMSMHTKHGLLSKTHHCMNCGYHNTSY